MPSLGLLRPGGLRCPNNINRVGLQVKVARRLHTLVILVWIAATARLALSQLRVQASLLIRLAQLHALHWVLRVVALGVVARGRSPCRIHNQVPLLVVLRRRGLHRVETCVVLGTDLPRHHLLRGQLLLLLALEAALGCPLLEALADVQGRRSEIVSILTIRCGLFA